MATFNWGYNETVAAAAVLKQYVGMTQAGVVATTGISFFGINQIKPNTGDHTTVRVIGVSKFQCGSPVSKGAYVTVAASGYFYTCLSGSYAVGKAVYQDVASGGIGSVLLSGMPTYVNS